MKGSCSSGKEGSSSGKNTNNQHTDKGKDKSKSKNKTKNETEKAKHSGAREPTSSKDPKILKILRGQKATKAGSSASHAAAQSIQCSICLQTFQITANWDNLEQHVKAKHPNAAVADCFSHVVD